MTAAIITALAIAAVVTVPVLLWVKWDAWRADQNSPFVTTSAGTALADAIAEHILAGGKCDDIIGGTLVRHPSGAMRVELITNRDAEHVGDEVEAWLGEAS